MIVHLSLAKRIMDTIEYAVEERSEVDHLLMDLDRSVLFTAKDNDMVKKVMEKFDAALNQCERNGPTAKLWIQYFKMVILLKQFLEAERSGNWELHLHTLKRMLPFFHVAGHFLYAKSGHLYLQDMQDLHTRMPAKDFQKFTAEGYFTIRRSDKFWSGIMSDQAVEQTLNREAKIPGGMFQRGASDNMAIKWTMGSIHLRIVCEGIEDFCGIHSGTSEQHVDCRPTRVSRDNADVEKLDQWFHAHDPFPVNSDLMSISSGVIRIDSINCHQALEIGTEMLKKVIGVNYNANICTRRPASSTKNQLQRTSCSYMRSKAPKIGTSLELFKKQDVDEQVLAKAGERLLIAVYGGGEDVRSLNELRFNCFTKSVSKAKFNLATLPPTTEAAEQHIYRSYLQTCDNVTQLRAVDDEDSDDDNDIDDPAPLTLNLNERHPSRVQTIAAIRRRRPYAKKFRDCNHYRPCPNCEEMFSKLSLRSHVAQCDTKEKGKEDILVRGRQIQMHVHEKASTRLAKEILAHHRQDVVTGASSYDELCILYGNKLCRRYRDQRNAHMLRSRLREIGKFILAARRIDEGLKELRDIIQPKNYDTIVKAIN
ncbi:unnamed protein product [Phaedon cochleariae]|uniref:Uncharacterized protein n=1 Tax=Phaedon cochleariae TaxID=80249 RepID=A0A9N9SCU7_PHACE|nr:unnamed protein product [Phaedon cochleariae]